MITKNISHLRGSVLKDFSWIKHDKKLAFDPTRRTRRDTEPRKELQDCSPLVSTQQVTRQRPTQHPPCLFTTQSPRPPLPHLQEQGEYAPMAKL
jgi:hypothetical protein